jgi:hypothetical protein
MWDHLIYAYLIENTRAEEIVRRLIYEVAHGERLGMPTNDLTFAWLQITEDLFYSYGPSLNPVSIVSQLRPEPRSTRRNAYFRMFGMDLNHGTANGRSFPYEKAPVANRDFIPTFEAFLRENWQAIEHARNTAGPNPTDLGVIADLALRLQTMLNERRGGANDAPNLARQEFSAVAAMSWLHLLVAADNAVLNDFKAAGSAPEERLARLGQRVGIPAHAHSHSFFILAPIVSKLLIAIEAGIYSNQTGVALLHQPPRVSELLSIIDHWSRVTARNLKALPVSSSSVSTVKPRPLPALAGTSAPAPAPSPQILP